MLVLSMRSQDSSPNRRNQDSYTTSVPTLHREPSPDKSDIRTQVVGAMLSMMPQAKSIAPSRPKLSLKTAIPPSPPTKRLGASLNISTDSPTTRNTYANTFDIPPPTPSSAVQPYISFPSTSIPSPLTNPSSTTSGISPFPNAAPYVLPIGAHSILRNSPLPRRHHSATTARRRFFPPVKRVAFQEKLSEVVPTPFIEEPSDLESDIEPTEDEHQRRRDEIQAEDGHATPLHGRRKRSRREWIWRPLGDDVLIQHEISEQAETPTRIPLPDSAIEDCDPVMSAPSLPKEDAMSLDSGQ